MVNVHIRVLFYCVMLCGVLAAAARAADYYVATNGSDTAGTGSAAAPFATFGKAHSVMGPGDDIAIGAGVYYANRIYISKSGTPDNPIVIKPMPGAEGAVTLDMRWKDEPAVIVYGAHVIIEDLELCYTSNTCVRLSGESNVLRRCRVHHAVGHGVQTSGTNNVFDGCEVYMTVLENVARGWGSGWGSAVKVYFGGKNTLICSNTVYHNYGEGICVTRGMGAVVRDNCSYDNYAVLIYIDNSYDVLVERNHCYSFHNPAFTRNGVPAAGIALAEEFYSGWGAQLRNVRVINNVVDFADRGIVYYGSDASRGGLSNVVIAYNTFWGSSNTAISIEYESAKLGGSYIANNLVQQPNGKVAWIHDSYAGKTGLRLFNNFWVGSRPDTWRNCNGPGDTNGNAELAGLPVTNDAFSFAIANISPAVNGASNVFGVPYDYAGSLRALVGGPGHDMGAFEAVPEAHILLPLLCAVCWCKRIY